MKDKTNRELDILVAKSVMGMSVNVLDPDAQGIPHYSTNRADAEEVARIVGLTVIPWRGEYLAGLSAHGGQGIALDSRVRASAETPWRAICVAALIISDQDADGVSGPRAASSK